MKVWIVEELLGDEWHPLCFAWETEPEAWDDAVAKLPAVTSKEKVLAVCEECREPIDANLDCACTKAFRRSLESGEIKPTQWCGHNDPDYDMAKLTMGRVPTIPIILPGAKLPAVEGRSGQEPQWIQNMRSHNWVMRRMGGNPANAESYERIRYCEICGIEDICEDNENFPACAPLPASEGQSESKPANLLPAQEWQPPIGAVGHPVNAAKPLPAAGVELPPKDEIWHGSKCTDKDSLDCRERQLRAQMVELSQAKELMAVASMELARMSDIASEEDVAILEPLISRLDTFLHPESPKGEKNDALQD